MPPHPEPPALADRLADLIGHACPPFTVEVEKGAIRRFAEALGDRNPIRHDEDAARAAGHPGLVASPTFPASFRLPGDPPWMARLDRSRIRAGEQGFRLFRPIVAGDRLTCRLTLTAVERKEGRSGPLTLLVQDLDGHDADGAPVFTNRRVAVHLGAP
ncbi:FAS1-like dehydratase domain-containing protein [Azospirillum melinis]